MEEQQQIQSQRPAEVVSEAGSQPQIEKTDYKPVQNKPPLFLIILLVFLVVGFAVFLFYQLTLANRSGFPPTATSPDTEIEVGQESDQSTVGLEKDETLPSQIKLTIISPQNNSVLTTATVKISGQTEPGAEVLVDTVETVADPQGNFSATITLEEGENYVMVTSVDDLGNSSETELVLTYNPPASM